MSDVAIKSQEEKDEFAEDRAWLEELLNDSPLPLFFIESRKRGRGGMPKCVLSNCGELIRGADYRVRVGTIEFNTNSGYIVVPASPEMVWTFRSLIPIQGGEYHVKCFELAAALFDVRYLNRISLVIRDRRDLCPEILSQICVSEDDKRYLDGGAMRLAISWLSNRLHEVAAQEWLDSLPKNTVNGEIWRHAGSAKFRKDIIPDNLKDSSLVTKLAPFESDGEGDTEEWNMHTQYWSLFLGQALGQWSYDKVKLRNFARLKQALKMTTHTVCSDSASRPQEKE